ncbi:MAG: hypothetical protein AB7K09_13560 [Planctomycetota bacterium]
MHTAAMPPVVDLSARKSALAARFTVVMLLVMAVLGVLLLPAPVAKGGSTPEVVLLQGEMRDSDGAPVNLSNVTVVVKYYDGSGGGATLLLTETLSNQDVTDGAYSISMGSGSFTSGTRSTFVEMLQNEDDVYFTINVDGDGESSPPVRLHAVPYAIEAEYLDGKNGNEYLDTSSTAQTKSGDLTITGQMFIDDGSVSAPGLAFASENSTGIYRPASNQLSVAINGAEKLRADADKLSVFGTTPNEVFRITSAATNDDPTEQVFQARTATTDATVTTIWSLTTSSNTTYLIDAYVVARRTNNSSESAGYIRAATFRNASGTASQVGTTGSLLTNESTSSWNVTYSVSSPTVNLQVTGAASNDITWHATVRVRAVSQ